MLRSKKIRRSAHGEECTVNGPNCDYGTETTVFCHLDEHWAGKGMGLKADDIGFYACYNCHIDEQNHKLDDRYFYIARALYRTWKKLIEKKLISMA